MATAAVPRYERHTLLHLNRSGRERLFAELTAEGYAEQAVGEMLLPEEFGKGPPVPGIARREEFSPREGFIPVGFVSWRSGENGRLRIASFIRPEEVASSISPEEVMEKAGCSRRTPAMAAVIRLREAWENGLAGYARLGVWGSAALEIETGRPFTHQYSDLDVRLTFPPRLIRKNAVACLETILAAEDEFALRIDAEVLLPDGYGVSLKELLQQGATVLGKGLHDVALLRKTAVFAC